jgi:quinol monooxygenase YgiN
MNFNQAAPPTEGKLLRHMVMFQFKADAKPEQVDTVVKAFAALPSKIKEIHAFEWGTNNSPEGLNKGLTHCFLVTFKSEEARAAYLPHPAHQEFVTLLKPILQEVTVVDYWTE